jgi:hypothetical protein
VPFTFSHPVAVFPAKYIPKQFYSLTGLVVGSIIPDFEYFIRMNVSSWYSHSPIGLFWFDLPLSIVVAFAFHCIVRNQLIDHFPLWLYQRFAKFKSFEWISTFKKNWPVIVVSILAGASSHILWDDFTHPGRFFVRHILFLRTRVNINGHVFPVYNLLQALSSLIGACVILVYIIKLPAYPVQRPHRNKIFFPLILLVAGLIIGIRFLGGLSFKEYGNVAVTTISSFLISIVVASLILNKANKFVHEDTRKTN